MDLFNLPAILTRWWYVVVFALVVAVAGLGATIVTTPPTYEARVTIQITAPNIDDVQLISASNRSSSILRDDLLLVRNDLNVIVQSPEVRNRTVRQLTLTGVDANYDVTTAQIADSNYLSLVARSRTPELAQSIANNHAIQAIQYYGELRAKPATTTADFLDGQLEASRANIASLQKVAAGSNGFNSPELQQAVANYQILLQKHSDAALAAKDMARVPYIQVVEPASDATKPSLVRAFGATIGLALVGALGLATLLALLLESLFPRVNPGRSPMTPTSGRAAMPVAGGSD